MKLSQYLYRRPSGHYYFRVRTPQALKSIINTVEIKRSLKTTNLTIASKRALPFLSFIVRISAMTDIDEILRQLQDSGIETTKFEAHHFADGSSKVTVDPNKEGDVEAAAQYMNAIEGVKQAKTSEKPQISLQSVMDEYAQERITSKNWTPKTKADYLQAYNLLLQIIGSEINTSQLSYEVSRKVKKTLLLLPPNASKI